MGKITRERLTRDLRKLGIRSGDSVMLHSSLSSLGLVQGGAETVVDAFLEVIDRDGTMIFPAFAGNIWEGHPCMEHCSSCSHESKFCPSDEPGREGIIAETFRRRPGALRGCHPAHSWCALGAKAELFLKDNYKSKTPCGRGNPFEKLVEEDGCIVCLGVMVNTITLWHYYEDLLNVPYLGIYYPEIRNVCYAPRGRRIQYEFPGIMDEIVKAAGIMKVAKVGKGSSRLIRAGDFKKFIATIMADDPYCFVVRPPDRTSGDLVVDALQKGAAMLRAWRDGPKELAGKFDWPEPDPNIVREDCPAFAGYHKAYDKEWPLCKANYRHPDLFKAGKIFDQNGLCCCSQCSWHLKFQK